jgi:hypothetical protein
MMVILIALEKNRQHEARRERRRDLHYKKQTVIWEEKMKADDVKFLASLTPEQLEQVRKNREPGPKPPDAFATQKEQAQRFSIWWDGLSAVQREDEMKQVRLMIEATIPFTPEEEALTISMATGNGLPAQDQIDEDDWNTGRMRHRASYYRTHPYKPKPPNPS